MQAQAREGETQHIGVEEFGAEIEAIGARARAQLGPSDARHIRRVVRLQRSLEISGRGLLLIGALPPAWGAGVAALALSKILENMEIGHNVLHGQYDWMNDPALAGTRYEWDWACPAAHWRHAHNYVHHTFTNIVGKDRDIGYGLLRMADEQPWHPIYIAQPIYALFQMLMFDWAIAVHDLELDHVLTGKKSVRELRTQAQPMLRKAARQMLKEYVLWPIIGGPCAPFIVTGNLSANVVRNGWAFLVIFCGHFPDGVRTYSQRETERETRADWYLRQVRGSANIEGGRWFHVLSGHLSHQIEHHLFPDLPACRYPEIAPEVRRVCEKHGVTYNTGTFSRQLAGALRRIVCCALPRQSGAARNSDSATAT